LSLSEEQKRHYRVHRFQKVSIYGGYFFEHGYNPMIGNAYIEKWKNDFRSNLDLAKLLGKLF
jgi:hypothetical protein